MCALGILLSLAVELGLQCVSLDVFLFYSHFPVCHHFPLCSCAHAVPLVSLRHVLVAEPRASTLGTQESQGLYSARRCSSPLGHFCVTAPMTPWPWTFHGTLHMCRRSEGAKCDVTLMSKRIPVRLRWVVDRPTP